MSPQEAAEVNGEIELLLCRMVGASVTKPRHSSKIEIILADNLSKFICQVI